MTDVISIAHSLQATRTVGSMSFLIELVTLAAVVLVCAVAALGASVLIA